jgi:hypothetical protein
VSWERSRVRVNSPPKSPFPPRQSPRIKDHVKKPGFVNYGASLRTCRSPRRNTPCANRSGTHGLKNSGRLQGDGNPVARKAPSTPGNTNNPANPTALPPLLAATSPAPAEAAASPRNAAGKVEAFSGENVKMR